MSLCAKVSGSTDAVLKQRVRKRRGTPCRVEMLLTLSPRWWRGPSLHRRAEAPSLANVRISAQSLIATAFSPDRFCQLLIERRTQ